MSVWTSTPARSFRAPWTQNLDSRPLTSFLSGPPSRRPAHLPIRKVLFGVGQTNRLDHLCLKRKQQLSHLSANHLPRKGQDQGHLKAISSEQGPPPLSDPYNFETSLDGGSVCSGKGQMHPGHSSVGVAAFQ